MKRAYLPYLAVVTAYRQNQFVFGHTFLFEQYCVKSILTQCAICTLCNGHQIYWELICHKCY